MQVKFQISLLQKQINQQDTFTELTKKWKKVYSSLQQRFDGWLYEFTNSFKHQNFKRFFLNLYLRYVQLRDKRYDLVHIYIQNYCDIKIQEYVNLFEVEDQCGKIIQFNYNFDQEEQVEVKSHQKIEEILGIVLIKRSKQENPEEKLKQNKRFMDGLAHVSQEQWDTVSDEMGWYSVQFFNLFLYSVTAADGTPYFYNKSNEARYDSETSYRSRQKALEGISRSLMLHYH